MKTGITGFRTPENSDPGSRKSGTLKEKRLHKTSCEVSRDGTDTREDKRYAVSDGKP